MTSTFSIETADCVHGAQSMYRCMWIHEGMPAVHLYIQCAQWAIGGKNIRKITKCILFPIQGDPQISDFHLRSSHSWHFLQLYVKVGEFALVQ